MKLKVFGMVSFVLIFLACFAGLENNGVQAVTTIQFAENQLTLNNSDQVNPDIYQYDYNWWTVVWQDNRNGNWDIYMYCQKYLGNGNWETQWDTRITSNSGNNLNPKIYNDAIVYQSDRSGNWDIYMYNTTSKTETQITSNPANQEYPTVYGDIIVWQDHRDEIWDGPHYYVTGLDIYLYNLTSQTEQRLPITEQNAFSPAISGDSVVYAAENYVALTTYALVYPYVCSYNLSTGLKTVVADRPFEMRGSPGISVWSTIEMNSPAIDGNLIAWTDFDRSRIGVKNMSDPDDRTWQSSDSWWVEHPDVSGRFVVYQSYYTYGYWHIKLYDFFNDLFFEATNALGHQQHPAVSSKYANFIVYQDDRSGHWHIYITAFWYGTGAVYPPAAPITPSRVISNMQEVKGIIADTPSSDFAGANNKVRENRKNAMLHQIDLVITDIEAATYTQNLKLRAKYFQSAINQMNDMISKLDGWSSERDADVPGSGFTPDWITTPLYLDQLIRDCRNDLQTLLNGIT